jgi:hypothetical protein
MTYDQSFFYPDSPMAFDIKAIEYLYGGSDDVNIGDDVYSWDINHYTRSSVIDDGGVDQYNFSNFNNGVFINLGEDSWSSITNNQILENDDLVHQYGQIYTSSGTLIEQVVATEYSDIIYDNGSIDNIIHLGSDNDNYYYFGGSDQVYGGLGADYVYLDFISSDFYSTLNTEDNSYSIFNGTDQYHSDPLLKLDGIEYIQFIDTVKTPNELLPNLKPTSISLDNLTVDENVVGAHIANITGIDPKNDELTFSILEGSGDAHLFMIMDNMLHLKNDIIADFEDKSQLEVTVRASDPGELSIDQPFTINVLNDTNDDPLISPPNNENILIQSGLNLIRLGHDGNDNWSSDLIAYGLNSNSNAHILQPDGSHIIDEDFNSWTSSGITSISTSDLDSDGNEDILIQSGLNLIRLGHDGNDNWSSDLIAYGLNSNSNAHILQPDGSHIIDEDFNSWTSSGITSISTSDLDSDGNEDILIQSGLNLIRLGHDGNDNWSSDLIAYGLNSNSNAHILQPDWISYY